MGAYILKNLRKNTWFNSLLFKKRDAFYMIQNK